MDENTDANSKAPRGTKEADIQAANLFYDMKVRSAARRADYLSEIVCSEASKNRQGVFKDELYEVVFQILFDRMLKEMDL